MVLACKTCEDSQASRTWSGEETRDCLAGYTKGTEGFRCWQDLATGALLGESLTVGGVEGETGLMWRACPHALRMSTSAAALRPAWDSLVFLSRPVPAATLLFESEIPTSTSLDMAANLGR